MCFGVFSTHLGFCSVIARISNRSRLDSGLLENAKALSYGIAHILECGQRIANTNDVPVCPQPTMKIGGLLIVMRVMYLFQEYRDNNFIGTQNFERMVLILICILYSFIQYLPVQSISFNS